MGKKMEHEMETRVMLRPKISDTFEIRMIMIRIVAFVGVYFGVYYILNCVDHAAVQAFSPPALGKYQKRYILAAH